MLEFVGDHGAELTDGTHAFDFAQPQACGTLRFFEAGTLGQRVAQLPRTNVDQAAQSPLVKENQTEREDNGDRVPLETPPEASGVQLSRYAHSPR